jgi:cysteine desulfurase/selenocysteine lyase
MFNNDIIYFDNGATTFKPKCVVDAVIDYYTKYTANAHRGDYDISGIVDSKYEGVRDKVKNFIGAAKRDEIIYTKGTTESINTIVFGYMFYYLNSGDEVLITKSEHASNILPWLELARRKGVVVKFIPLNQNHEVTMENLKSVVTDKTKVISLAHITNVIGDVRPIEEIGNLCREKDILFIVDAAQSIGHMKMDVNKYNISFLAFSAHKMLGPTGVGILYGKSDLLNKLVPLEYGGGMNSYFESSGELEYKPLPERLEAGTQNIAGVIGLGEAIDYIQNIGLENIHKHELELKKYALRRLREVPNLKIYNENSKSGIVIFNLDKIFSQDTAVFLNHFGICVRAGNHCAKIVKDEINVTNTCRASFYLYNTKEEIDKLVDALKQQDRLFEIIL